MQRMKAAALAAAMALCVLAGCTDTVGPSPEAAPVTSDQVSINGTVVAFARHGAEWSLPTGGQRFGDRNTGYTVTLLRLEGRRLRILDPGTKGEAYVDLEDLALPTEIQQQVHAQLVSVNRTVVSLVSRPGAYTHSQDAILRLTDWMKASARDGDR